MVMVSFLQAAEYGVSLTKASLIPPMYASGRKLSFMQVLTVSVIKVAQLR